MFAEHFMNTLPEGDDAAAAARGVGSRTLWAQRDAPLRLVDPDLAVFAERHGLTLRHGNGSCPSRTLEWSADIDRVIQLYLDDSSKLTYTLVVGAKCDLGDKRRLKALPLRQAVEIEEIAAELPELLETALASANAWSEADLDFTLDRPPAG